MGKKLPPHDCSQHLEDFEHDDGMFINKGKRCTICGHVPEATSEPKD